MDGRRLARSVKRFQEEKIDPPDQWPPVERPVAERVGFELKSQTLELTRIFYDPFPEVPRKVPCRIFRLKTDTCEISSTPCSSIELAVHGQYIGVSVP